MNRVYCLGSINIDMFYDVPHIPAPGETLSATGHTTGLGGKGANQSVAAAQGGVSTHHVGAIGPGSDWIIDRLESYGVDTTHIAATDHPTGHAIINVAADGENAIVILAGANAELSLNRLESALTDAEAGDILLIQNETNLQTEAAELATAKGLRVLYSAAPFDADAAAAMLPHAHALLLNEIEAQQLEAATGKALTDLPVPNIIVTLGSKGARWIESKTGRVTEVDALRVIAVDTTGAGDTFAGYIASAIARGLSPENAMRLATKAAALKVTRKGTADAIPSLAEVEAFTP